MPASFTLSTPIQAHDEELRALSFRDLTAKDIRTMGYPFTFTTKGEVQADAAIMTRYIVALANIPTSSVDQLAPFDFLQATQVIMGFFAPATAG